MDKTEQYIKMCDCPEIQGKWKPNEGDFYIPFAKDYLSGHGSLEVVSGVRAIREEKLIEYLTRGTSERLVWLPRQDQIQEMIPKCSCLVWEERVHCLTQRFWQFVRKHQEDMNCLTMEQLWLAFYMLEKHSKSWGKDGWKK